MTLLDKDRRREDENTGYLIKENQVLNARIEHLEKVTEEQGRKIDHHDRVALEFEKLKVDLKWTLGISKVIVAVIVFLTGDEIKRKLGL